jgi:hypothetical protein
MKNERVYPRALLAFLSATQICETLDQEYAEMLADAKQSDLSIRRVQILVRRLSSVTLARRTILAPTNTSDHCKEALTDLLNLLEAKLLRAERGETSNE